MSAARWLLRALITGALTVGVVAPAATAHAEPSLSEIQQEIDKFATELEKTIEAYNLVTEERKATEAELAKVTQDLASVQGSLDTSYAGVADIAASAYKGRAPTAAILLAGNTPGEFMDRLTALNQIARADQRHISEYLAVKVAHDANAKRLQELATKSTGQQAEIATRKTTIQGELDKLYTMREQAAAKSPPAQTPSYNATPPDVAGAAGVAVRYAYGALGTPYVFGGASPAGYDCSGLTQAAWAAAGYSLPHNAAMQWNQTVHIPRANLQPGDLAFYNGLGHVGIYVGNNQIIHAAQPGTLVSLASVDMMPPYGFGRVT